MLPPLLTPQISLVFPNEKEMIITQGTKDFARGLYERVFGYNPAQLLEEQKKMDKERRKAEEERQQLLRQTVLNLHQLAQMEVPQIALMVEIKEEEVEAILTAVIGE